METEKRSRYLLAYCTLAGLLASIVISGLLFSLDFVSKTPFGTFFAVIGSSLGYYDSNTSPYIGLLLHFATGTVAGNLLGQGAIFWKKLIPFGFTIVGIITGILLWLVLFLPLTTYVIQPKLNMFNYSAPNQYIFVIAQHFQGLYSVVLIGSFFFHIIYGIILGLIAGRLVELKH
ncbi:MAG: hypothetical protein E6L01_07430 [Thaumarchaeota archaeon]|nr:MAG: hypothetical protein E6L01_07430 [Nitrososphaerota archaeon]